MSVGGDRREVAVGTQMFGDEFANDFLIIDDENVQRIADVIEGDRFDKLRSFGNGEINFESGPHAFFAEDPDLASVAVNDSIDHRQPESRAFFAFGGEERFEALDALAFGHADTGICDCEADAFEGGGGADDDFAPGGEGIDRIEDEIRQDLADFRGVGGYEADVVEAFVRHAAAFVDHHLIFDHASTDIAGAMASRPDASRLMTMKVTPVVLWTSAPRPKPATGATPGRNMALPRY